MVPLGEAEPDIPAPDTPTALASAESQQIAVPPATLEKKSFTFPKNAIENGIGFSFNGQSIMETKALMCIVDMTNRTYVYGAKVRALVGALTHAKDSTGSMDTRLSLKDVRICARLPDSELPERERIRQCAREILQEIDPHLERLQAYLTHKRAMQQEERS